MGDGLQLAAWQSPGNEAGFVGRSRWDAGRAPGSSLDELGGAVGVWSVLDVLCRLGGGRSLEVCAWVSLFLLCPQDYPDALITNYYVSADSAAVSSAFLSPEVPGDGGPPAIEIPPSWDDSCPQCGHCAQGNPHPSALFLSAEAGGRPVSLGVG